MVLELAKISCLLGVIQTRGIPHFPGTLACCTCHVILSPQHYERVDRLNPAGEEVLDLLDLAPERSDCSRLRCENGVRVGAVHVGAAGVLLCTVEWQLFSVDLIVCCTSSMLSLFDCQVL
ncbi:hypothetical protein Y032_0055g2588 [Ancylostoma ceylanicum]|uniref:Uncharacterized protein n=1 Tax=Ancylostoma ceylanicum TaxID=53326 RepID=A0A016U5T0_9BILA|nr:hypothetical protein Y032_0055g2588 [Ancylostoma ceylanicum]